VIDSGVYARAYETKKSKSIATEAIPADLMCSLAKALERVVTVAKKRRMKDAERSQRFRQPWDSVAKAPVSAARLFQACRARFIPACCVGDVMLTERRIGAR
jgi:hypothetical protein